MQYIKRFFYNGEAKDSGPLSNLLIFRLLFSCFGLILLLVFLYGAVLLLKTWPIDEYSISKAGTFGDSFGALNCLFTGLGFAGLLTTIFLQREELKLSRVELADTREEIRTQGKTFQQQQFEESFYNLLSLYKDNLSQISIKSSGSSERNRGVDALRMRQQIFEEACESEGQRSFPLAGTDLEKEDYLYWLYKNCNTSFSRQARYIETLNALLSFIRNDCYSSSRQEVYLNILSSQFTIYEIKYIFYSSFLNPNYNLLREVFELSPSFKERFSTTSIPSGHYEAFKYLWGGSLSQITHKEDRLFARECFKAARAREAQRRRDNNRQTKRRS